MDRQGNGPKERDGPQSDPTPLYDSKESMRKPQRNKPITRRTFVAGAGIAGAAMSSRLQGRVQAAAEEGKTVTLAFVGCAHIHTPDFIKLLNGRKNVKVKYVWDYDAAGLKGKV